MLILHKRCIDEYEQCSHISPGLACCENPAVTVRARLFEHCVLAVVKNPSFSQIEMFAICLFHRNCWTTPRN